jgi:hypothetical protein
MNRKPSFFIALLMAFDPGVHAGRSAKVVARGWSAGSGAKDQNSSSSVRPESCSATTARAFSMVASIFIRLRMMRASASSRSTSSEPNAATRSGSKPAKTSRNAGRLRSTVIQESPDWKPSRAMRSSRADSPCTGTPHSSSWYAS